MESWRISPLGLSLWDATIFLFEMVVHISFIHIPYSIVCMCRKLSIYRHFCLGLLWIKWLNILAHVFQHICAYSAELLGGRVGICLVLVNIAKKQTNKKDLISLHSHQQHIELQSLNILTYFGILCLVGGYVVIMPCFLLHFSHDWLNWSSFLICIGHLHIIF